MSTTTETRPTVPASATCLSCGAAYGTGHYSWCDFRLTLRRVFGWWSA